MKLKRYLINFLTNTLVPANTPDKKLGLIQAAGITNITSALYRKKIVYTYLILRVLHFLLTHALVYCMPA